MKQTELEETFKKKYLEYLGEDTTSEPEGWYFKKKYTLEPMLFVKELLSLIETKCKEAIEEFVKSEGKRIALDRKKLLLGFGKDKE